MKPPIPNHKQICRALAPKGWVYGGYDAGRYLFQSGSYATGFQLMECFEEDLTPENLAFMAEHGLTRTPTADQHAPHEQRPRQRG